ncbi:glycoside hydrolase family 19 protein [Actinacidiphila sp. bgisy167]|uniref:glycoside hydrolase family 19 protein n=1 Tax=Actinacidiphila sp. bgisy167 TaxID=3413797 RepID=UPI003D75D40C
MSTSLTGRLPAGRTALGPSAVFAVLAALLVALFVSAPTARAADGQISGLAGKCVDVAAANSANGTAVQLYDCNGTNAQRWSNPGDGTLRALGKCLDVVERSTANGASVQLWDCTGGANQQWVVTAARDIVNPAADKCLDVRDNNSANGTRLQIWSCTGGANQKWNAPASGGGGGGGTNPSGFVVSEAQFNQMFPGRSGFYTYSGLVAALSSYPGFANSGSDTVKKQEAAAFLANVSHETGGLVHVVEQNTANYSHYCDWGQPYGCPAGQSAYYGRGPIQLSWNFNYKAAGDALNIDLLNNPWRVEQDAAVAWRTGLWYWNTQSGPGTMTPHNAMVNQAGFGQTIRSINGSLECDGRNPAQVQSRVSSYQQFTAILGVSPGGNLYC